MKETFKHSRKTGSGVSPKAAMLLLAVVLLPMNGEAQRLLTLDSCRAMALRNNKQMSVAKVKQDVNANLQKSARTKYLPHVSALGGYVWMSKEISMLSDDKKDALNNLGTGKTQYGVTISSTVTKIVRRKNGLIWIGTLGQGLFTYNPQNREMKQDSRHVAFVSDIVITQDGKVYVVSLQGNLLIYNANGAFRQSYQIPDYVFDKNSICLEHTSGETFLGTDRGLYHLSDGDKSILPFTIPLPDINIRSLKAWGKELLVGTEKGLYLMDLKRKRHSSHYPNQ